MNKKTIKSKGYSILACIFKDYEEMYKRVDKRRTGKEEHNYNGIFLGEQISKCFCKGKHDKKNCDFRDTKHLGCICIPEKNCTVGIVSHEVFHAMMELKHRYKIKSTPGTSSNEDLAWMMGDFIRQFYNFYYDYKDSLEKLN